MTELDTTKPDYDYDVVIAGGGMVGASLALLLSTEETNPLSILVVESFPVPGASNKKAESQSSSSQSSSYSPSFDARSTALSFGSRKIFESMSVWTTIAKHASGINSIHVSERGRLGSAMMSAEDAGWPELGYVVENAWLGSVLMAALAEKNNVTFAAPASVANINLCRQGVDVEIDEEGERRSISAQLAVIADGAHSALRQQLGIDASQYAYHQTALIANVSFSKPHQGLAYERFTDQGPMALLPLANSEQNEPRAALVWTMDNAQAEYLTQCDSHEFLQKLQQRFGHRQGEFVRVGERFNFPLQLIEAKEQVRSGLVVMGNAAHSLHPVAGQGFNLALRDCARLSELLLASANAHKPLGELTLLQNYQMQQYQDQQKTIIFSDQLTALFARKQWPVSLLRRMGLVMLDAVPIAKQAFVAHAAGMHDGAAGASLSSVREAQS